MNAGCKIVATPQISSCWIQCAVLLPLQVKILAVYSSLYPGNIVVLELTIVTINLDLLTGVQLYALEL